ncbi:MAG TPA: M48 family metallopeptidase, partial [Chloroflexota bacterium]
MASQELDQRFMTFADYIAWRAWKGLSDDEDAPPYAHPVDGWILRTLESTPVKNVLDKAIDTLISVQLGRLIAESVAIDHKSFPDLYDVLSDCSRTLGIPVPHALTLQSGGQFNAFMAGTDEYSFIFITDGLLKFFTQEEARFVIGHECGHIAAKHLVYHTLVEAMAGTALQLLGPLGRLVQNFAGIPLRAWARRSEVTCDRAGLICCADIKVAERALIRLATGFADADKVDIDDYLRRSKEMSDFHGASKWQEVLLTHPLLPKRIEALRLFARSELYYDLAGQPAPAGVDLLTRAELDRLTN